MARDRNPANIKLIHEADGMTPSRVNVLLVEDNLAEARLLQEVLKGTLHQRFLLCHVKRLAEAIAHVEQEATDVILLDLTLPDSAGLESLETLIQKAPSLPVVVLTNTNDDDLAIAAVRRGAQDYLVKRHVNQELLVRSLRYAIERKQSAEALREANEILEHRVQERTAELESANELLRQEIEQRQRIQERLELAQKAGKISTFEWNVQTNHMTWSAQPNALDPSGSTQFDGAYHEWVKHIHPDDRTNTKQELWQAVTYYQGVDTEFRLLTPQGEIRWTAVKGSVFYDHVGQALRVIGIHMDITEKKQLEAQFLRAQRLESLGTLASGIAHDLNNILTPILAIVQLLPMKWPNLDSPTQRLIDTLDVSAQRGITLVQQILSFARGVEGKRITLQVYHLLREVEQIISQTFPKSITVHCDLANDLWNIFGDATQLHQVFMNLCVNARDAMPTGGTLKIQAQNIVVDEQYVRTHVALDAGAYVVVTIADTGIGMTPEVMQRIFDPFFTTKDVGKGTGLGLSAVLGIVNSHNGCIDVQSVVNQGSQFQIFLPACESTEVLPAIDVNGLMGQQELIFVLDDEQAICDIMKVTLESYNYRTLTATDANTAIALFQEHADQIHCVLMDLMMPSLDGLTALPMLKSMKPDVMAIAMSGLNATETVTQAEQAGFQGFLAKPFTSQELLQAICQLTSS